jgi:anthranilate synthase component 2
MILLIDNYDSFTYNLYQQLLTRAELQGEPVEVVRNDRISLDWIRTARPRGIVISPGPGAPPDAGESLHIIREVAGSIPILGVCLGHQAIGQVFGAQVVRAPRPIHGKISMIHHDGTGVFAGLVSPMKVARYHSLLLDPDSIPASLSVNARTADGLIMAIEDRERDLFGVQFHPESFLTEQGELLISNYLRICMSRNRDMDVAARPPMPDSIVGDAACR